MGIGCKRGALGLVVALGGTTACGSDTGSMVFDSNGAEETGETFTGSGSSDSHGSGGTDSGGADTSESMGGADTSTSMGADDTGSMTKLDVGAPWGGFGSCECELIYLWVADYRAGTVSKINTRTLEEEGRYLTRPDGNGNPSRTSVNLSGDVAVANRYGGLTKFFANPDNCVESNGIPGIQTSTGKDDVLPWEEEECRAWYSEFPTTNQRPVAWTSGTAEPGACDASNANVWTVTSAVSGLFPGLGGAGGVIAYLVDGQTGGIVEEVPVDDFPGGQYGAYGGAVDAKGNLYFSPLGGIGSGLLGRVDAQTLEPTIWTIPSEVAPYGITVDHKGRVWLASNLGSLAARFDPITETWAVVDGFGGGSGLAEGPDNLMYVSSGSTVRPIHIDDLTVGDVWTTDEAVKGVSFDADGYLWAVTYHDEKDPASSAAAYKIDVMTMMTEGVYHELDDPYTYSDMTGNALGSVACAPEG